MTPFVSFLLKANLALILLYGFYFLCFRRDTFYGHIRWYLLLSTVSVIIFPFIDISTLLTGSPVVMKVSQNILDVDVVLQYVFALPQVESTVEPIAVRTIPWGLIFGGCWLSVFVFMLGKRLFQFVSIIRLGCRYPRKHQGKGIIIDVERNIQPFSFANCIFLNTSLYTNDELDRIIAHEQVHCRQGHTVDILLAEMLVCLFWFNPVAWLLRRDIKQNIEYYTDRMTLRSGFDRKHYQYSLLQVSDSGYQIVNHFHFNNLKKRIIMMNKKETPRMMTAKYLLVIPALAAALLTVQISGLQAGKTYDATLIDENLVFTNVAVLPALESVSDTIRISTQGKIKSLGEGEPAIILDGKIISNEELKMIDPLTIESVSVIKDSVATNLLREQAANGIIIVTSKTETETITGTYTTCDQHPFPFPVQVSGTVTNANGQALPGVTVAIKGETIGTVTDMNGNFSLDVPDDNAALEIALIGMASQEIVVNIHKTNVVMSDSQDKVHGTPKKINFQSRENSLMYIVDGEEVNDIENIVADSIQSFDVLKDQSAIKLYGEKGKNGVVIITTKK